MWKSLNDHCNAYLCITFGCTLISCYPFLHFTLFRISWWYYMIILLLSKCSWLLICIVNIFSLFFEWSCVCIESHRTFVNLTQSYDIKVCSILHVVAIKLFRCIRKGNYIISSTIATLLEAVFFYDTFLLFLGWMFSPVALIMMRLLDY